MSTFEPANSKNFQLYFMDEETADQQRKEFQCVNPDQDYIVKKTNKKPDHPYELYYRKRKEDKQRLGFLRRKTERMER